MLRKARISEIGPEAGRPCMPRIGLPARLMSEKSSTRVRPALPSECHRFQDFDGLGPAFAAVGDAVVDGACRGVGQISDQIVAQIVTHRCQIGARWEASQPSRPSSRPSGTALGIVRIIGMVRRKIEQQGRRAAQSTTTSSSS